MSEKYESRKLRYSVYWNKMILQLFNDFYNKFLYFHENR